MFPGTTFTPAASAGAAAEAARRRANLEEEVMTKYGEQELSEGWEFKILHAARGTFKNPERMQEILRQEARAGWILLEKFDNSRIRLKRPPAARRNDRDLDFDPYRSYVGTAEARQANRMVVIGLTLLAAGLTATLVFFGLAR